ncbi:MAG: hypothetical protein A2381_04110 [Bdellovibrionales bacterium RIFOXYB1_FULL_37_110]|nr:MAG: hypothetical protein A2181_00075 [Bdellovibrionales bacterium RIFOXYA1_FULL_38_20]OFZ59107.1 MAG: hypothetical protein A2381_04110 [Bdellovibrionales bacterium RIFOXYB1_FULL_37_110]
MFSGTGSIKTNNPYATNMEGGPISFGEYSIVQVPGKNPRNWFLDPGFINFIKKIGYVFGLLDYDLLQQI